MAKKKPVRRRKKVGAKSVGLSAPETAEAVDPGARALAAQIVEDGGAALAVYREPFGGTSAVLATLPIDSIEPTPYQRDPSEPHVKRLMNVIEKLGRFLDPIITVRHGEGYWTPNGNHRLQAMRKLGARSVVALVVPEADVAFKILALNTEKAHNLKEKSLETIRMLRALADDKHHESRSERDFEFEFEQPPFLTLGAAYEQRPRLSGGAYNSVLRRVDDFLDERLSKALKERTRRAGLVLEIDDHVAAIVDKLKKKGFTSPYLRPFVVARINPIRFSKSTEFDFDDVLGRMQKAAAKFNVDRVKQEDVVRAGGGPADDADE
jgi:ParB family transcriptional regulator, chromosome partitioning protein